MKRNRNSRRNDQVLFFFLWFSAVVCFVFLFESHHHLSHLKHHVPLTCWSNLITLRAHGACHDAVKCQRAKGGCVTRAFICLWRETETVRRARSKKKNKREERPTTEGDEDLPKPKAACAARSPQQPTQPQQQRHESARHGQHHHCSPTHPQRTGLYQ